MPDYKSLEPSIDPNHKVSFLLDWELTMKCNLDCSYCGVGIYSGHDNSTQHPSLGDCLNTIDFMYQYVDLYMQTKPQGLRYVTLNVYGGESLHHPTILEILTACREKYNQYKDSWVLTITTTTNAIISEKKFKKIIPLIDKFTCSFHSESSDKQKLQFKQNLLTIKESGRQLHCVVLMHSDTDLFNESCQMIEWCKEHSVNYLPRQLDHVPANTQYNYNLQQVTWFNSLYTNKNYNSVTDIAIKKVGDGFDLSDSGRACCGGKQLCIDQNQKQRTFFVDNKFPDWYCSVNNFFVYIKQVNGEIFTNKDCKMGFNGKSEPIGHLSNTAELLEWTADQLSNKTMPIIQCKKYQCLCGLCAPKAKNLNDYNVIMKKYQKTQSV